MGRIEMVTAIRAPIERCFDLSRSIDLHVESTARSGERAVGGRTSGLIEMGESVTWKARHFGVWQELSSRIVEYDRPRHFRDSQVKGAFKRFDHDHDFRQVVDGTEMRDVFDFENPLGLLGRVADKAFLTAYLRRFLKERNRIIKETAESDGYRRFLTAR